MFFHLIFFIFLFSFLLVLLRLVFRAVLVNSVVLSVVYEGPVSDTAVSMLCRESHIGNVTLTPVHMNTSHTHTYTRRTQTQALTSHQLTHAPVHI